MKKAFVIICILLPVVYGDCACGDCFSCCYCNFANLNYYCDFTCDTNTGQAYPFSCSCDPNTSPASWTVASLILIVVGVIPWICWFFGFRIMSSPLWTGLYSGLSVYLLWYTNCLAMFGFLGTAFEYSFRAWTYLWFWSYLVTFVFCLASAGAAIINRKWSLILGLLLCIGSLFGEAAMLCYQIFYTFFDPFYTPFETLKGYETIAYILFPMIFSLALLTVRESYLFYHCIKNFGIPEIAGPSSALLEKENINSILEDSTDDL